MKTSSLLFVLLFSFTCLQAQINDNQVRPNPDRVPPSTQDMKPNTGGVKPSTGDIKPNMGGVKPNMGDVKPGGVRPDISNNGVRPISDPDPTSAIHFDKGDYTMTLLPDGKLIYTGLKNTDKIGTFTKMLSPIQAKTFISAFNDADVSRYNDPRTEPSDDDIIRLSFMNNNTRQLIAIDKKDATADQITRLKQKLESLVDNQSGWVKSN